MGTLRPGPTLPLPPALAAAVAPRRALLAPLNAQIVAAEAQRAAGVHADDVLRRLTTGPGVGPGTAAPFGALRDTAGRGAGPQHVAAYLGRVPAERRSGARQPRGAIPTAGNRRARRLLVQAAGGLRRPRSPEAAALQRWARQLAARRGKHVAAGALARRLAGTRYALWREGTGYQAQRVGGLRRPPRAAA
jgi:transposase